MDLDARLRQHTLPFLSALLGYDEHEAWGQPVTWQTFDDREQPDSAKDKSLTRVLHGSLRQHIEELESLNLKGAGVFISVNGTDFHGRQKANIQVRRALWTDLDEKLTTSIFSPEILPIVPTIIVATGHGWHIYWRFSSQERFTDESRVKHEQELKRIYEVLKPFGADPKVCTVQAVMRVPGFFNRKRQPHPLVELALADSGALVTDEMVRVAFPAAVPGSDGSPKVRPEGSDTIDRSYAQAKAYMTRVSGVAEGERNAKRYWLACFLTRDKALPDHLAFDLLNEWNALCMPPESPQAVWESIHNARRYGLNSIGSGILPVPETKGASATPQSQIQTLLGLIHANVVELFHTADQRCFASVRIKDGTETFPVKSQVMADWIRAMGWRTHRMTIREESVNALLDTLSAEAQFDGKLRDVFLRTARQGDSVFIDTCRPSGDIIQVDPDGWIVIRGNECPIRFIRSEGMLPLPIPIRGGSITDLRPFVYGSLSDFQLLVGWCLAAMAGTGQYPLLGLFGEAGSAKTFLTRLVRCMLDPCDVPFQGKPSNSRDLYIRASHSHCLALNNLSEIPQWLSDDLCGIALGSGFATRELNTDRGEIRIQTTNPIVINGIPNLFKAADLADRGFPIVLERLPNAVRIPERSLWDKWDQVHPRVFGAMLDLVAGGIRLSRGRTLPIYPRLADVAVFLDAAEEALMAGQGVFSLSTAEWGPESWRRGDWLAALLRSQRDTAAFQVQDHPVTEALVAYLKKHGNQFTGTATELLAGLNTIPAIGTRGGWPKRANALSAWFRTNGPALRAIGIDIQRDRTGDKANDKLIQLRLDIGIQAPSDPEPASGDLPN
jgi:hypothetical protein